MEHKVWSVELNEQPAGRLLVFGRLLMVSTQRTERSLHQIRLWAYELADGNLNWSRSFEQVQVSGLVKTLSEAVPLVVALDSTDWISGQGMLLALDIHGEVQWRHSASVQRLSAPAVDGNIICVTAGTRTLSVVSVETGVEQGKVELDVSASFAAPAVANGVAYVPCRGPHLLAVGFDGRTRWRFDVEGVPDRIWLPGTPTLVKDQVITTTSAGSVIALKTRDGSLIWQTNVGPAGKRLGPSATDGERIYVGASDGLYALDSKDGREVWTFSTVRRIGAAPVLVGGVVYVTCHDHHAYALDALSGKELWRREMGKRRIELAPVVTSPDHPCGARVLVADRGGALTTVVRPLSAEEHQTTGHWEEAVSVYIDLGLFSRAAQLLESHNEPLRAAELWETAGEKERAALQYEDAQAWQRAAQFWELLNRPLRQAQALKQYAMWLDENEADISSQVTAWHVAAQAFETEGKVDELAVCQQEIARRLQQPLITVDVKHEGLVLNRWTRINFVVRNEGYGTAHQLIIRAAGDQFEGQAAATREIVALKAGRERAEWLDIRPCQHGDSVPLRLSVEYRDDKGNIRTNSQTVHLPVARADIKLGESQSWQIHTGGGNFIVHDSSVGVTPISLWGSRRSQIGKYSLPQDMGQRCQ
ncbi:MAG: PQQ-binding-like beta-propeller repeat protein, partial [Anaerolineae bacterium]|nr:PQQ-binding-like beta-propeller repeat protein [Anaerolineae bacterium]